jgi:lipopolysaccharide export LptBFGC system permease protein LptF
MLALVMTLMIAASQFGLRPPRVMTSIGTYIFALFVLVVSILTVTQSPALTLSPSMLYAASGYHSHHAEAL